MPYGGNRAFWSALEAVAVYLDDVGADVPRAATWEALSRQLTTPMRNAGPTENGPFVHFEGIQTYDDLYRAQYAYLRDRRGADTLAPPPGGTGGTIPIPRTTNGDVMQLATYWSGELARVKHVIGHDATVTRWIAAVADVDQLAKATSSDAVYAKNNEFWRDLQHVSTQIAVADEAPSKWDMFVDSLGKSVTHLPETIANVTSAAVDKAASGVISKYGVPVLVGAGVLGLLLLARSRP